MAGLTKVLGWLGFAVVAVIGFSLISRGCASHLKAEGATVQAYFHALGTGDAASACGALADSAQAKLKAQQSAATCQLAVSRLHTSLTQAQREELVKADISVNDAAYAGSRKEITLVGGDPLGYAVVVLSTAGEHEMITDWGWDARQLV
ncbi:hypothetical protein GCM10010174_90110 [Kutzneria viridogrisea]|uniref:Uncharacterized protein n=2 Tax=Kutzneria TaxID=43356 RepID=W5WFC0_9PSEU|nr:hypothetical protein [Kutzneria albida]AHH99898.1 hypothetical protein KALB_6539 [Kutzneria albida DSM 43870]MBA8925079.1 hypothetical protein [Kutzneria viridogrisea]